MATTSPTVFITVPKYVTISPNQLSKVNATAVKLAVAPATTANKTALKRIAALPALSPASSDYDSGACSSSVSSDVAATKVKKRRLDHLTWEEKVQRKKLKNRVAAQTSRDRKKARMEEMEIELKELTDKTEILQNKCESLQAINDTLFEKNHQLDKEVELLRQQLTDIQKKQKEHEKNQSAGCESIINGSAAGFNGHTVERKANEKIQHDNDLMADCSTLPTIQDMLLLDNGKEFNAEKLEEFVEGLLADIAADMESSDRACDEVITETSSGTERLSGSMVGTTTECMESSEHSTKSGSINRIKDLIQRNNQQTIPTATATTSNDESAFSICKSILNTNENDTTIATACEPVTTTTTAASKQRLEITSNSLPAATPDTVYGTYDAKTNSITINMDDVSGPVSEAVEEICCDGVTRATDDNDENCIRCPTPTNIFLNGNYNDYINVDDDDDDDDDIMNFDPIAKFLCPKKPMLSPLAKSPAHYSVISDHGYESNIGSPSPSIPPTPPYSCDFTSGLDDFNWNNSFIELFPSLVE